MTKKEYLKKFIEENGEKMNDITIDFLKSYDIEDLGGWIDDKINEFADSEVAIYYSDLDQFAANHSDIINDHWDELSSQSEDYYQMLTLTNYFYNQELLYQDNYYINKYVEDWEV